jgi:hypothetical protein
MYCCGRRQIHIDPHYRALLVFVPGLWHTCAVATTMGNAEAEVLVDDTIESVAWVLICASLWFSFLVKSWTEPFQNPGRVWISLWFRD